VRRISLIIANPTKIIVPVYTVQSSASLCERYLALLIHCTLREAMLCPHVNVDLSGYKNTNHQQMHKKSFIINRNTLLHVSTLLGHLQGELFCYRYTKVALYSWMRMCCWLCTGGVNSLWSGPASRDHRGFTPPKTTQYTVNSTFSLNCKVQP
jgi:hypothetical protein